MPRSSNFVPRSLSQISLLILRFFNRNTDSLFTHATLLTRVNCPLIFHGLITWAQFHSLPPLPSLFFPSICLMVLQDLLVTTFGPFPCYSPVPCLSPSFSFIKHLLLHLSHLPFLLIKFLYNYFISHPNFNPNWEFYFEFRIFCAFFTPPPLLRGTLGRV